MAKTAAERQRARRERLKSDHCAYDKYRKRDKERKQKRRAELTDVERLDLQERNRIAVAKFRANDIVDDGDNIDRFQPITEVYRTPASLGKARRKVVRSLPRSPRKRSAVLKTLAYEYLDVCIVSKSRSGLTIPQHIEKSVVEFYQDDSISRMMPGKADYVTIRDNQGRKAQIQKRHMYMTIQEAFCMFSEENPDKPIGKSRFASLRPKWVLLSSQMPRNVCGCTYHSNIILMLECLHQRYPDVFPLYSKEAFWSKCICSPDSLDCALNECQVCCDGKLFDENFSSKVNVDNTVYLDWYQWTVEKDNFVQKTKFQGLTEDAMLVLKSQITKFNWHCFIKQKQATSYNVDKDAAIRPESNSCVLQMDFAENFTCSFQDEIQSAHWRQRQVTVYTIMIYHRAERLSYVIASDCRNHDKSTVAAFTSKIIKIIEQHPTISGVNIWTDGPSSQYKNKFIFALLPKFQDVYNVNLTWNYFSTSHGKGPNDALGGNVKRIAFRKVSARSHMVSDACSFAEAVQSADNVKTLVFNQDAINSELAFLQVHDLWQNLKPFPGTINVHHVTSTNNTSIATKYFTSDDLPVFRELQYVQASDPSEQDTHTVVPEKETVIAVPTDDHLEMEISFNEHDVETDAPRVEIAAFVEIAASVARPEVNEPCCSTSDTKTKKQERRRNKLSAKKNQVVYKCPSCLWAYGDPQDPLRHDDWIKCSVCKHWYHMKCGETNGIIDDNELLTCASCL